MNHVFALRSVVLIEICRAVMWPMIRGAVVVGTVGVLAAVSLVDGSWDAGQHDCFACFRNKLCGFIGGSLQSLPSVSLDVRGSLFHCPYLAAPVRF